MNTKFYLFIYILSAGIIFSSCKKNDDVSKPTITITELGEGDSHGNDHTAIIGGDLHIEAEILAEGKISTVQILIHLEGDHKSGRNEEWEVDTTYTKFVGLKNTEFHEHIGVDTTAYEGDYHFDMIVIDMEGNQTSAEADLLIKEE